MTDATAAHETIQEVPSPETDTTPASHPNVSGVCTALAELPRDAHLDAEALGRIFGRCKKTIQLAWRRGDLPPPIKFMGRHVWIVGTILDHLQAKQEKALEEAQRRERSISQLST